MSAHRHGLTPAAGHEWPHPATAIYVSGPCADCLEAENIRLRAALAEYANEDNWYIPEPDDYFPSFRPDADTPWLLAREALRPLKPSH